MSWIGDMTRPVAAASVACDQCAIMVSFFGPAPARLRGFSFQATMAPSSISPRRQQQSGNGPGNNGRGGVRPCRTAAKPPIAAIAFGAEGDVQVRPGRLPSANDLGPMQGDDQEVGDDPPEVGGPLFFRPCIRAPLRNNIT